MIWQMIKIPDTELEIPICELSGRKPGPHLTLTAGVHSREYVGMEALLRLAGSLSAEQLSGKLTILPICNYDGLICRSADVMPADGLNLNRVFPGRTDGSVSERFAHFLLQNYLLRTDYLVDLHSGGFCEALIPHVYFPALAEPTVSSRALEMARQLSVAYAVRSEAQNGLYSATAMRGVPAILLERGGSGLWSEEEVSADLEDIRQLMSHLGLLPKQTKITPEPHVLSRGYYLDAPRSGLWYPRKKVGEVIQSGEILGCLRSLSGDETVIRAQCQGVILYQTISLGLEAGKPMIAYGSFDA